MKVYHENGKKYVIWLEYPDKYAYTRKHIISFNNGFEHTITDLTGNLIKNKNNQIKIIKYINKSIPLSTVLKDELKIMKRINKINKLYGKNR